MLIHSAPASGELSSYMEASFSLGVKWEDDFPRSIFRDFAEPMSQRASCRGWSGGSREFTGVREPLWHCPHGPGARVLPWMLQPWLGAPWSQPLLLQTLPCLSCLEPQHSRNARRGCVQQPGIGAKAVAGNNNKKLGYRSSRSHCWPPAGRVLQGL